MLILPMQSISVMISDGFLWDLMLWPVLDLGILFDL